MGEPGDMVEVEVGQHDVELVDSVEQRRLLDQAPDPGARVDQDRLPAPPEQGTRCLTTVGGEPASSAEDRQ